MGTFVREVDMKDRKIAVNSNCYHGFSLDDAITGIKAAGFSYIELTATKGWTEHVFPDMSFETLVAIKQQLKDNNLTCIGMSGHCNLMDTERLDDFRKNIHLAHFYDCEYIVSSIGEAHIKDKEFVSEEQLVENIKSLLPLLISYQMMLVLEVHGEHGSGVAIDEIVKKVNSPLVKIAYDSANAVFYGGVDVIVDMKACIEDIAYVHIKDKAGAEKEWNFPALGEGYIPLGDIFSLLDEADNNAPLSIEIEFTQEGPKDVNEVHQALKTSKAFLERYGYSYD